MKFLSYFGCILLLLSCGKPQDNETQLTQISERSVLQKHVKPITLSKTSQKKVEDWKEYEELRDFIQKFNSISPNEALSNARGLNVLVKSLNDSIKPTFIESPAFSARVNLLYNETLRLYDMSTISSIKANEVNIQVEKILEAYSSMNSKISTVIQQEILDREVEDSKFDKVIFPKESIVFEKKNSP